MLDLLVVWIEFERAIHLLNGFLVPLSGLIQKSNVDQDIYLVQVLLCLLGLLEGSLEVGQRLIDLSLILREEHAHVVVWEERLIVDF